MDMRLAKELLHIRDPDLASWRSALAEAFDAAETQLGMQGMRACRPEPTACGMIGSWQRRCW